MTDVIRILGIDPALNNVGLVLSEVDVNNMTVNITDMFLLKTENQSGKVVRKNSDDLRRANEIFEAVEDHCSRADIVMAEIPVGTQSARGAMSNGICVGVLASIKKPLIQVTPSEAKLVATGRKTATKAEMIEWATRMYPLAGWLQYKRGGKLLYTDSNEHLADAVAIIHAGIKTQQFRAALGMFNSMKTSLHS